MAWKSNSEFVPTGCPWHNVGHFSNRHGLEAKGWVGNRICLHRLSRTPDQATQPLSMARGQNAGRLNNCPWLEAKFGSRPESHCRGLKIGLPHRHEAPRLHAEYMLSPSCDMVSRDFLATSDEPLHCQKPSLIMSHPCRGDQLLFAFDVLACCYLEFIGMT